MVFAANGLEALDQVQQAPFDVVVTDRRMPGISGEELIKRVLQTAGRTACIILTGDMEECDNRPEAAVYITKPCKYEELVAAIEEGIERSRGEGTAVT